MRGLSALFVSYEPAAPLKTTQTRSVNVKEAVDPSRLRYTCQVPSDVEHVNVLPVVHKRGSCQRSTGSVEREEVHVSCPEKLAPGANVVIISVHAPGAPEVQYTLIVKRKLGPKELAIRAGIGALGVGVVALAAKARLLPAALLSVGAAGGVVVAFK